MHSGASLGVNMLNIYSSGPTNEKENKCIGIVLPFFFSMELSKWWLSLVGLMLTMILLWNLCCRCGLGREIYAAVSLVFVIGTALLQSDCMCNSEHSLTHTIITTIQSRTNFTLLLIVSVFQLLSQFFPAVPRIRHLLCQIWWICRPSGLCACQKFSLFAPFCSVSGRCC
jgi:hypothetical protein